MSKTLEVLDEETGIKLIYTYDDKYGWSFVVSGYPDTETRRKAMLIAGKYFPKQSEEHKKLEQEMIDFCRSVPIDRT